MANTNIKTAYAMINGQKVLASYSEATGLWTVETAAPAESSWSQPDHVYQVTLHAEDLAGNKTEMTSSDPTYGSQLKIRVLEKTAPTATILKPTESSVFGTTSIEVSLKVADAGGSGLNMSSVVFKVNDVNKASELQWSDESGGTGAKVATYTATGLSDGNNKLSLAVTDNDGNVSNTHTVNFIVATAGPTLEIESPVDNLITNASSVNVTGYARAGSEFAPIMSVKVNGNSVSPDTSGRFSSTVTLQTGENQITIVAEDSIGRTTSITRTVIYDKAAPVISDVVTEALTVDASGMIKITFKVTDSVE